jgi:hypothetical protein
MFSRGVRRLPGLLQTDSTLFCNKQTYRVWHRVGARAVTLATRISAIPQRSRFMSSMTAKPNYTNRLAEEKSPYLLVCSKLLQY